MTKFSVVWETRTTIGNFSYFCLELNAVVQIKLDQVFRAIGVIYRSNKLTNLKVNIYSYLT